MRILYLHQYFTTRLGTTGTRSYEFSQRLCQAGHDVVMVTSAALLPSPHNEVTHITTTRLDGLTIIIIPVPYSNKMSFARRLWAFFQFALVASRISVTQKADVIFATSTPLTIAIPAILGHLWQRIPMVFEVRDLWPELPIAVGALKNPVAIFLARILEWIAYHASVHIVALSPGMADGVIRRGIESRRVTVIPNSCDVSLFDVPKERGLPIRERLGLDPDQPLIVYTGAFGIINGVDYLVELAAAIRPIAPEIRFLLVGDGNEREKVFRRARETGIYEQTLWIWEPQPKVEIPNILAAATVATSVIIDLKAIWNNSANKFFDALAARKPIMINHGGWQADLLEQTGAGIVLTGTDIPLDAQRFAAWVQNAEALQHASEAAHHLAYHEFNRDLMAQKLEMVLQKAYQRSK